MKTYNYSQIICCSSEKSLDSGTSGFGVRAKSPGLSVDQAYDIYIKSKLRYSLDPEKRVKADYLRLHTNIVSDYPHIYALQPVTLSDGTVKYIVARVIYVGGDYGFFIGAGYDDRVGSNYILHILVFDQKPPIGVVSSLITHNKFLPSSSELSLSNTEFKEILIGESYSIEEGTITLDDSYTGISPLGGEIAIALLQAYSNKDIPESPNRIIVKLPKESIAKTITELGWFPFTLTQGIAFNANVLGQSSVPDPYNMILVNESDDTETLNSYHIVIDARNSDITTENIVHNYLFGKIRALAKVGDIKRLNMSAELYMTLCKMPDVDFEQSYKFITWAGTEDVPTISDIQNIDFNLLGKAVSDAAAKSRIWQKIDNVFKSVFTYPVRLSAITDALRAYNAIPINEKGKLTCRETAAAVLYHALFETAGALHKFCKAKTELIPTVVEILESANRRIPSEDVMFKALDNVYNPEVWESLLKFYYKENEQAYVNGLSYVISSVASDDFNTKYSLAKRLYPVSKNFDYWLKEIAGNEQLAHNSSADISDVIVSRIAENPSWNLKEVMSLPDVALRNLRLEEIFKSYVQVLKKNIAALDLLTLRNICEKLEHLGFHHKGLSKIKSIMEHQMIQRPDKEDIAFAYNTKADGKFIQAIIENWILTTATKEDISEILTSYSHSAQEVCFILCSFWQRSSNPHKQKDILWIYDNFKANGCSKKTVVNIMPDKRLKELLRNETGLLKTLLRKIGLMIVFVAGVTLMTSCDGKKVSSEIYYTPFTTQYLGDSTGIEKIKITEYNRYGTLINIRSRGYNTNGNLLYTTEYNQHGGIDSTIYKYDKNKLIGISAPDYNCSNFVYNKKNRLVRNTLVCDNGTLKGQNLNVEYSYTPNGICTGYKVTDNSNNLCATSEYILENGKVMGYRTLNSESLEECLFDNEFGRIKSLNTYSVSSRKLQKCRNYAYEEDCIEDVANFKRIARLTNSKGKKQGRVEFEYAKFLPDVQQDTDETCEENITSAPKNIINPPLHTNNIIHDYINSVEYRVAINSTQDSAPGTILIIIVLTITICVSVKYYQIANRKGYIKPFTGTAASNGMKKLWMFTSGPYIDVSICTVVLIIAFVTSVALLLALGGITYGLLWVVKIILILLVWLGWSCLIVGILGVVFAKSGGAILLTIFGGIIVAYEDSINKFGESCVNWGFDFMNQLNLFKWGISLFTDFWDILLLCFMAPLIVFVSGATLVIILICLLWGLEWLIMKIYNIHRPCPVCGNNHVNEYWADSMHKHPIKLHPGLYGVFTQIEPITHTVMPTLLIGGKGRLLRRCSHCQSFIQSGMNLSFGTEKHIGFVGPRSSGKSYLLYTLLHDIINEYGSYANQVDNNNTEAKIDSYMNRIRNGEGIQTDVRDSYRALQIILRKSGRPIPYHLFFYDVAGEKFNQKSTASRTAMDFYRNVNQIIFLVDPTTIDFTGIQCSEKMKVWLTLRANKERFSLEGTMSTLKSILESAGRNARLINLIFVLVKADTGYLEACGYSSKMNSEKIKTFIQQELGLSSIINTARGTFNNVQFSVSSVKPAFKEQLRNLSNTILSNLGMK